MGFIRGAGMWGGLGLAGCRGVSGAMESRGELTKMNWNLNRGCVWIVLACLGGPLFCVGTAWAAEGDRVRYGGAVQFLAMERDYGDGARGQSASVAATIDVAAKLFEGVEVEGQCAHVARLGEGGRDEAAYWLSNDEASGLNRLRLSFGGDEARLSLGRLPARYDFFPAYKARHKEQGFEGATLEVLALGEVKLEMGHIERFSAWPSREGGASRLTGSFVELSESRGLGAGDEGVQFVSGRWGRGRLTVSGHDYWARGFYNDAGLSVGCALTDAFTLAGRVDAQEGEGGGEMAGHRARASELCARFKRGALGLEAGWTRIAGASSFAAPFRTAYAIDGTLLWYTSQFESGADSLHAKASYKWGRWALAGTWVGARHRDERIEQELDAVVKCSLENSVWVAFKAGFGTRSFEGGRAGERARDLRMLAGYEF